MYRTTAYPALLADIKVKELKNGKIRVIAKGVNPEDERVYAELGAVTSKAVTAKRREYAANESIHKLEQLYLEHYGRGYADEETMKAAFRKVKAEVFEKALCLSATWKSPQTNQSAITFFERNTLPLLLPFVNPDVRMFLESDKEEIQRKLAAEFQRRKRDKDISPNPDDDPSSEPGDDAMVIAARRLQEANIIYQHMCDKDERLPALNLRPSFSGIRAPLEEQLKSLPREALMKFYARLRELVEKFPREVFFTIFVIFNLRPAEAAARKPHDIVWQETFCTAEVNSQAQGGKMIPRLKRESSRRLIIIPYWGMRLLKRCCELIGDDYPKDDSAMNDAVACSRWVKELLLECGCDEVYLEEAGKTLEDDELDDEDCSKNAPKNLKQKKIACYVLRRLFAGNGRNIAGLTSYETDRLMGHAPIGAGGKREDKQRHPDLNAIDTQRMIARKMERYVYDPLFSLNPAVTPYTVAGKECIDVIEYSEMTIENDADHDVTLELALEGAEMGERMSIAMPASAEHNLSYTSMPISWEGRDRTVISDTTPPKGRKAYEKEKACA